MLWILVIFMIFLFKIEKHVRQLRGFKLMKVYTTSHTIPSFYHTLSVLRITCLFSHIEDFGVAKTERDIGFYTGFVGEKTLPQSFVILHWNPYIYRLV